jgi:hypothetical protein
MPGARSSLHRHGVNLNLTTRTLTLHLQVGWVCQALASIGMPYSPTIYYTSNNMGRVFFWIFALFPWNPLTKGVLDMSAAASSATQQGECARCMKSLNLLSLHMADASITHSAAQGG